MIEHAGEGEDEVEEPAAKERGVAVERGGHGAGVVEENVQGGIEGVGGRGEAAGELGGSAQV